MENRMEERTLTCVMDGRVVSVSELWERAPGGGFAVIPSGGFWASLWRRLRGVKEIRVFSPADGVVTVVEGSRITLRTGDGVLLNVELGEGGEVTALLGEKLHRGAPLGKSGVHPALVVFPNPEQITELHVAAGRCRRGRCAAFYRVREA